MMWTIKMSDEMRSIGFDDRSLAHLNRLIQAELDGFAADPTGDHDAAVERVLEAASFIMNEHGVERVVVNGETICYYVNNGETYRPTLCYDCDRVNFVVSTWGQFAEDAEALAEAEAERYYRLLVVDHHDPFDGCNYEQNLFLLRYREALEGQEGDGDVLEEVRTIFCRMDKRQRADHRHIMDREKADFLRREGEKPRHARKEPQRGSWPWLDPIVYTLDDVAEEDYLGYRLTKALVLFFRKELEDLAVEEDHPREWQEFQWACPICETVYGVDDTPASISESGDGHGIEILTTEWGCEECAERRHE